MSEAHLLQLVSRLTEEGDRRLAARALARFIGAKDLVLFLPDPQVKALLPAPGFPQTLPNAGEWHAFLRNCPANSSSRGFLVPPAGGEEVEVLGIAGEGGSVLVLLGGSPSMDIAVHVALLLPLLAAALNAEHVARVAEAQAKAARQAATQTQLLAISLDRARNSLRQALAEAENANHAKDAFLAALSHELRTPLSPVLLTAAALEMDSSLPPEVNEQAAVIRRNAELEARLIDDLLDLTRITHGKLTLVPAPVDVHSLLKETATFVTSESGEKNIQIDFQLKAEASWVSGDATRLQQVFWNIVKNAVKFTPPGGFVVVTTSNEEPGWVAIRVADSGIGIDANMLPRIFNAFEQAGISNHRFGGLGLGLAITRALVELHGGRIHARSKGKGSGATFAVDLETIAPPSASPASLKRPMNPASSKDIHILLVEDHESTRTVLARVLRRAGYEVHPASTGAEARELACSQRMDLVISDIGLPDESGLVLMQALKSERQLRGIALSGYGMEEDIRDATAAGFSAHLVKPVNMQQLRELLEQLTVGSGPSAR